MDRINSGYVIVQTFAVTWDKYKERADRGRGIYGIPEEGQPWSDARKRYRGLDRVALEGWSSPEWGQGIPARFLVNEKEASIALDALEDAGRAFENVCRYEADAVRVFQRLANPSEWEIMWVRDVIEDADSPYAGQRLGFEPALESISGNFFSPICDVMCFPKWHGPDRQGSYFREDWDDLNQDALFDTIERARKFLTKYQSFDLAESGKYLIAEIWTVR